MSIALQISLSERKLWDGGSRDGEGVRIASLGRQLNSVSQETTKLPHRRNDLRGLTRTDTMPWVLALRVICGLGEEGEPASQNCWR